MKKRTIKILTALLFLANILFAQVEYFVQVDPSTCNYTILDSIPIIKWISTGTSTFDKINRRFVFHGQDNGSGNYLCSVDATNGNTASIPSIPGNFGCLKFDNSTGILYGIHWVSSLSNAEFVSINPTTFTYTIIGHINLSSIGSDVTFDDINHRYIISASDSIGNDRLFSIDAVTGNIVSKPTIGNVGGILYDKSSGNIYGIREDMSTFTWYFVSVNITTGSITNINSLPLVTSTAMGFNTFDELNRRYTFCGSDNNNKNHLITLDASNGNVISSPLFPVFVAPYNLLETEYDNSTGNLYALHWGPYSQTTKLNNYLYGKDGTRVFPNPTNSLFFIETNNNEKLNLDLFDINGKHILSKSITGTEKIDVNNLDNGVYTLAIKSNSGISYKKLIIQK